MREPITGAGPVDELISGLRGNGHFLVTGGQGNPMTIGWANIGITWARPVMTILVRESRHSFELLEELPEFTVNLATGAQNKELAICGSKSGRDMDKAAACGFTMRPSETISVPYIGECPVHYECRVIHRRDVDRDGTDDSILSRYYSSGDFHRIYYGEILGVYRET